MRNFFIIILFVCAAYGYHFFNSVFDPEEISPTAVCTGVPTGTRLPNPNDCNRFILCDNGVSMNLACRTTDPHFNRCTATCVNDVSVCTITSCPGETTTTTTTNAGETTTPALTTTPHPETTVLMTTTPAITTTFNPPTVPVNIPCNPVDCETGITPDTCAQCQERWGCWRGVCECNTAIQCPFNDPADCITHCGCAGNCECTGASLDVCVCHDTCRCIEPPQVCPFLPSLCVARCGCVARCNCRGDFCTCDTALPC